MSLDYLYASYWGGLWDSIIWEERKKGDVSDLEILLIQVQCRTDPRSCLCTSRTDLCPVYNLEQEASCITAEKGRLKSKHAKGELWYFIKTI